MKAYAGFAFEGEHARIGDAYAGQQRHQSRRAYEAMPPAGEAEQNENNAR